MHLHTRIHTYNIHTHIFLFFSLPNWIWLYILFYIRTRCVDFDVQRRLERLGDHRPYCEGYRRNGTYNINLFATGACSTEETFLQYFLAILKWISLLIEELDEQITVWHFSSQFLVYKGLIKAQGHSHLLQPQYPHKYKSRPAYHHARDIKVSGIPLVKKTLSC